MAVERFDHVGTERLDLVETRTFGSRMIYERYGRARDESD